MNYADLMKRAISLAGIHKYTAKPNPVVGAILVKDDLIISEGAHEQYGMEHAEVNAINNAKKYIGKTFQSFEELTLLCTLEPCNHSGKTGPCSDAIIKSGIKKVIIGCKDPNPKVAGTGIKKLIDNDIAVELGLHEELIKEQNKFFFFKHENNRPYITVKIASSSDGKSHNLDGSGTWITCKESREDVQIVRAMHDSILTGGNTLVNDNPRMNARVKFAVNQPKKILLTSKKDLDYKNQDLDQYQNWLSTLLMNKIGKSITANLVQIRYETAGDKVVCLVDVKKSNKKVFANISTGEERFFVRVGNSTRELTGRELLDY